MCAGGGLRKAIATLLQDRSQGAPLFLLLHDASAASLVSGWAWSQRNPDWLAAPSGSRDGVDIEAAMKSREGICAGFAQGSSAFSLHTDRSTLATDLCSANDLDGWHAMPIQQRVGFRHARRIEAHLNEGY